MGFLSKMKDILFDDVDEPVTEKKPASKKVVEEEKIAERIEPQKRPVEPVRNIEVEQPKVEPTPNYNDVNDRDLYKVDNTFSFPDFDEEEFSSVNRVQQPAKSSTNVLEYEKKRKTEKRYDFGKYERIETKEVVEKKKFKPSPIISPVYGILNEDYRIEDIMDKTEESKDNNLDFNSVRKKAFGEVENLEEVKPHEEYYEETVTVKLKEDEKEEKSKTIDELLEETSDLIMDVEEKVKQKETERAVEEEKVEETEEPVVEPIEEDHITEEMTEATPVSDYEEIDNDLDEVVETKKSKKETKDIDDDDTLENDLFDLIDSMYDSREDGEF